jgi:hypothetical protein
MIALFAAAVSVLAVIMPCLLVVLSSPKVPNDAHFCTVNDPAQLERRRTEVSKQVCGAHHSPLACLPLKNKLPQLRLCHAPLHCTKGIRIHIDGNGRVFPVGMLDCSSFQGSAGVHLFITCRIGAFMLATLIAGGVPKANAQSISLDNVTFKATDDGLSIPGMFFAKLETMHAKHMSGEIGKVCLRPPAHCRGISLMCK